MKLKHRSYLLKAKHLWTQMDTKFHLRKSGCRAQWLIEVFSQVEETRREISKAHEKEERQARLLSMISFTYLVNFNHMPTMFKWRFG